MSSDRAERSDYPCRRRCGPTWVPAICTPLGSYYRRIERRSGPVDGGKVRGVWKIEEAWGGGG